MATGPAARSSQVDGEFTAWVVEHRSTLLRAATLLTAGDAGYAEDLVQATLTKLYLRWRSVRRSENTLAYARVVLLNTFLDMRRRAFRRRELTVADPNTLLTPTEPGESDLQDTVLAALRELPPGQRAVVVLRHWFDLDVATTARELGCSPGTVKSQSHKALEQLRNRLGHVFDLEEAP